MKWAAAVSGASEFEQAAREVTEEVEVRLDGATPDLALVFPSSHHREAYARLPELIGRRLGARTVVGCSGAGIIGDGRELEERPGLSVTAAVLPGVEARAVHLGEEALPGPRARAAEWEEAFGVRAESAPTLVLLADPYTVETEALLGRIDAAFPVGGKIGGLASGGRRRHDTMLLVDDQVHDSGFASLSLSGAIACDTLVAQGCRPIGDPMFVTACHENMLLELDGKPVLPVLQELVETLDDRDRELLRSSLFLGIAMSEKQLDYGRGDFLVRNIIGMDPQRSVLLVGARLHETQVVQFHLRDAGTSHDDLEAQLGAYADGHPAPPAGALLFSCLGRGIQLYGVPDHDTDLFRRHLGNVPLGGFFCNGEIGPVQGWTFLHGYTSSFGLFRPR